MGCEREQGSDTSHVWHLTVFCWQLLSAESHDSWGSSVIGRSVQQIVTKGTGVVQQFIRHR